MNAADSTLYIIGDDGDDEWVSPEPADEVIRDAVVSATDLDADDVETVEAYVDGEALAAVVGEGDESDLIFDVEGHAVTVTSDGDVSVE
jgi:hypothetical protein